MKSKQWSVISGQWSEGAMAPPACESPGTTARVGRRTGRGFSLMEVLLAVFILGIGLIMVATIFPVGAEWTRKSTEDSIAQTVAQNALTIIQDNYAPNGLSPLAGGFSSVTTTTLQALPSFTNIPVAERCYQYGNPTPFPAPNPAGCLYYWTALVRVQPGQTTPSPSTRYDVYILVFRKGDPTQTFPSGISGAADSSNPLEPTLASAAYSIGTPRASGTPDTTGVPRIGFIGIGQQSGTVFRQAATVDMTTGLVTDVARPGVVPGETVIYANPANNTDGSPLVYVYQTTITF